MKMHMVSKTLVAALFVAMASPALAQGKIGSIRGAEVLQQSPQFKAGKEKFRAEFEKRQNDLEAEAKKLGDDFKAFQKQADLLSAADRAKQEKDLNTRKIDFEYRQKQLQEDAQTRERQLMQEMMGKFKSVIEAVAKEKGLDIIVQDPVYAAASVDITADVLKRLSGPAPAK